MIESEKKSLKYNILRLLKFKLLKYCIIRPECWNIKNINRGGIMSSVLLINMFTNYIFKHNTY